MIESVASIKEWADTIFGEVTLPMNLARANEELGELITQTIMKKPFKDIAEEAGDIAIVLTRSLVLTYAGQGGVNPEFNFQIFKGPDDLDQFKLHNPDPYSNIFMYAMAIHRHLNWCLNFHQMTADVAFRLENIYTILECICLHCESFLNVEIDAKMVINRARKWNVTGQGTGYHVK